MKRARLALLLLVTLLSLFLLTSTALAENGSIWPTPTAHSVIRL